MKDTVSSPGTPVRLEDLMDASFAPVPAPAAAAEQRRTNAGDELTVDPIDRKRRANAALLELAIVQAARRAS